jgi:hypothetical protein
MKHTFYLIIFFLLLNTCFAQQKKWTAGEANTWYGKQGWLVGADFLPSTCN